MPRDAAPEGRHDRSDDGVHAGRRRLLKALGATGAVARFAGTGWGATGGSPRPRQPAATDDGDVSLLENRYMKIALAAAREAAAIHDESFGGIKEAETKAPQQLVTEVDRDAEEAIRDTIREELGSDFEEENHALFGEEEGGTQSGDYVWIIDPLDGTTNYVRGIPHFCVSIAVLRDGEPYLGLIYYSPRDEVYGAIAGEGALKFTDEGDGVATPVSLSVTDVDTIEESHNSVGFYSEQGVNDLRYLLLFRELVSDSLGIRQLGAAAIDMAFLAEGAFDTFSVQDLKEVDVAAGTVIVREAGGTVTDFEGCGDIDAILEGDVVATNGELHETFLDHYRNPRVDLPE
ncbi:inositol monophosphatase family protein [Halegenticoccus tardaugens]|uniref:inositol monophosphatase family protein n=1 Tax=Halegenticoccus tardaugens TaxID=2071624 RepID=UPI00100ADB15|nr:inositol monophosphatase family protein [Halegenticoccus tardaugens]